MEKQLKSIISQIIFYAKKRRVRSSFFIGNTSKKSKYSSYYTPLRDLGLVISGGAIVYSEKEAKKIVKYIDGKIDFIFVDAEKKIPDNESMDGKTANIERIVRENTKKSNFFVYKGNDLSVEAVDSLLSFYFKDNINGIGGKKVCIIGSGNLGSKIALKLVERGANVIITRRNLNKLKSISKALNFIKPKYTKAKISFSKSNIYASKNAEILIGATNGVTCISKKILMNISKKCILLEAGKGSMSIDAIKYAKKMKFKMFRLDINPVLNGLITLQLSLEEKMSKKMGSKKIHGEKIVSGGLIGDKNDIIVDNFNNPKIIYGIADGKGDFIKNLNKKNKIRLEKLKNKIK